MLKFLKYTYFFIKKTILIYSLNLVLLFFFITSIQTFGKHKPNQLNLKLEDQLHQYPIGLENNHVPIFASSKKVDGEINRIIKLDGDAVIRHNHVVIKGETITYDSNTSIANIDGNILLSKNGISLKGSKAKLKINAQEGWIDDPVFEFKNINGKGMAKRAELLQDHHINFQKIKYTTCDPENEDWYITASNMDVNRRTNSAFCKNGVLHFLDIPVLYIPTFILPVSSERRSGILSPLYSKSNRNGWDIRIPYYLNIAPNRDLTLYPRYLEHRGWQLGSEFRYLNPKYSGELNVEYLPRDKLFHQERMFLGIQHNNYFPYNIQQYVNFNKVSDDFYIDDIGNQNIHNNIGLQFNQEIGVKTKFDKYSILTRFQRFQILQVDTFRKLPVYERMPQFDIRYHDQYQSGIQLNTLFDYTRFVLPNRKTSFYSVENRLHHGERIHFHSSVARSFLASGYRIIPKVNLQTNYYKYINDPIKNLETISNVVFLPTFSLDSEFFLEKKTFSKLQYSVWYVTLEPRILYVYTPYHPQQNLPIFDTTNTGFGVSQIFTENTFIGYDRISDNNKMTIGITSRFIDNKNGSEYIKTVLAKRFDFSGQRVGLNSIFLPHNKNYSDVLIGFTMKLKNNTNAESIMQYNQEMSKLTKKTLTIGYKPESKKLLNISYHNIINTNIYNNNLEQYEISGQWPIKKKWYGIFKYNQDILSNKVLNRLIGIEHDANCWIIRLIQKRYQNTSTLSTTEIHMQLDFKGFIGIGDGHSSDLMRFNIPGYDSHETVTKTASSFDYYE